MDVPLARIGILTFGVAAWSQTSTLPDPGWAKTSVNAVVFRGNSIASLGNVQYTGYYDGNGKVELAKRSLGSTRWETKVTPYSGTTTDAHNCISLGVDGDGFLHMAWDMHAGKLRYARSNAAGSLEMGPERPMTGAKETSVTYPQFFRLSDGRLLFFYRDGSSGNGDLVIDRYDPKSKAWIRLQDKLIDGEGARNAYWEAHIDKNGVIHLGWVWRETSDVATNHDLCYARSRDGGQTWETSTGAAYVLPIKASTAEYALRIPQKSELINQTSIFGDKNSHPCIASYWAPAGTGIPQYQLVCNQGGGWKAEQVTRRTTPFSLSGVGTKKIPISRPQLVVDAGPDSSGAALVFRDVERGDKVSLARATNLAKPVWKFSDLTDSSVESWEPSFDVDLWNSAGLLDIFVQKAGQGDGEGSVDMPPQPVKILEWKPESVSVGIDRKPAAASAGSPAPRRDPSGRTGSTFRHLRISPKGTIEVFGMADRSPGD